MNHEARKETKMKKLMMTVVLSVAGIAIADSDVDALLKEHRVTL